jgi:hypothetical protein
MLPSGNAGCPETTPNGVWPKVFMSENSPYIAQFTKEVVEL